jgi:hypothetical protein
LPVVLRWNAVSSWIPLMGCFIWPSQGAWLGLQVFYFIALGCLPVHTRFDECPASECTRESFLCWHVAVCHACLFDVRQLID